jgi:hypothetical protein
VPRSHPAGEGQCHHGSLWLTPCILQAPPAPIPPQPRPRVTHPGQVAEPHLGHVAQLACIVRNCMAQEAGRMRSRVASTQSLCSWVADASGRKRHHEWGLVTQMETMSLPAESRRPSPSRNRYQKFQPLNLGGSLSL